jgi:MoaA/NifB/PqqE/SkfB family radical SAM enzyme
VTYVCNFRCTFCNYWKEEVNYSAEARRREATLDDFRMGSAKLAEFGSLMISMGGGEPFMRRDLAQITAALAQYHFPMITTNGWLVDEQRARELWDAGLYGISVSLDYAGSTKEIDPGCRILVAQRHGALETFNSDQHDLQRGMPGAAERARRAIQILSRTRTRPYQRVNLLCVLNDRNLGDLEKLIRFAAENHASFSVQPYCAFKSGHGEYTSPADVSAHLLSLKRRYRNFRSNARYLWGFDRFYSKNGLAACKAGRAFFNIDNMLNVQKCVEFREEPLGNLRDITAKQLVERLQAENRRNACTACWYGCRGEVEALYSVGGLLSAVPMLMDSRW